MNDQTNPKTGTPRPVTGARPGSTPVAEPGTVSESYVAAEHRAGIDHRVADTRSVPELLADLARSVPALVRQEAQLLRSELSDKVGQIEIGLGSIVAGAILLFAALLILLQAIVIALTEIMGPGWAALIVGIAAGAIGAVLLKKGADQMKASSLMPERTTRQLKQDAELAKEQVR
jgi:hypothetical protein